MDWLASNSILLDCENKRLIFSDQNPSTQTLVNQGLPHEGRLSILRNYMVLFSMEVEKEVERSTLPIVEEFLDVFSR